MPGNKWQHQESSSNSKPEFFTGQLFDVIGILVNSSLGCLLLPFQARMLDGYKINNFDKSTLKTRSADLIANLKINGSILVADAWYACFMFFTAIKAANCILISRVGISAVASLPPDNTKNSRGRPRKYGDNVKLHSIFEEKNMTDSVLVGMNGNPRNVKFWCKDLLWQPTKGFVRFVGSQMDDGRRIVLVCSDLTTDPTIIIQAYIYRTSIETTFWYSTQMLFNWCYRFWTKSDFIVKAALRSCNLHKVSAEDRQKFWTKVKAYECFILIGFFVQALLLFFIEKKPDILRSGGKMRWFRSTNSASISMLAARTLIYSAYLEFYQTERKMNEQTKFIRDQITKSKNDPIEFFEDSG